MTEEILKALQDLADYDVEYWSCHTYLDDYDFDYEKIRAVLNALEKHKALKNF